MANENNLVNIDTKIYICRMVHANALFYFSSLTNLTEINYLKYNIKETDFRVKTASFTTPTAMDLTEGRYVIKIV